MQKVITALALTGAAVAISVSPASAQESTAAGEVTITATFDAGPYRNLGDCRDSERQAKRSGFKIVKKCAKRSTGFFFSYRD